MNYKLIKKLPFEDGPETGYITKPKYVNDEYIHYWNGSWFHPVKYPEYWEPIKEKDYVILTLEGKVDCLFTSEKGDGKYLLDFKSKCEQDLLEQCKIKSVKRLSDGKIFNIGDRIYWDWHFSNKEFYTIDKFYFDIDDDLCFDTKEDSAQGFPLEYIKIKIYEL